MVYLIRHTPLDVAPGVCYGRLDVPLAQTANDDLSRAAAAIPRVERVFTSPTYRCRALAEVVATRDNVEIAADARLQELDFGAWEGQRWDDLPREHLDAWARDLARYRPGGGESVLELWLRVAAFRAEILSAHGARAVLIVAHQGPLRAWLAQMRGLPLERMLELKIDYGADGLTTLTT